MTTSNSKNYGKGQPAFPSKEYFSATDCNIENRGMTLRDYFAGQALIGMLSWCGTGSAKECYDVADAMLKERMKEEKDDRD